MCFVSKKNGGNHTPPYPTSGEFSTSLEERVKKENPHNSCKVGPQKPVVSRVCLRTPLIPGFKNPSYPFVKAIYRGYNSIYNE